MKTITTIITLAFTGIALQAQVLIGKEEVTNSSVLLEFGAEAKGIILPSVNSAPGAAGGTFIVNTTDKAVQYFDGTDWVNLTNEGELVEHTYTNAGTTDVGDGAIIGAETTTKPGVLVLESTTQALVLPKVANPHLTILSPVAGTMVYDTESDSLAVFDGVSWSYWN